MDRGQITYLSLDKLLGGLGFVETVVEKRWRAYRHDESDTLILLPFRDRSLPARELDVISIRKHLLDNDLVNESRLDDLFTEEKGQ